MKSSRSNTTIKQQQSPRIIPTRVIQQTAEPSNEQNDNSFVHEQNMQSTPIETVTLKTSETYIFGDIEGDESLFSSTMEILESHSTDETKFIFLGDLYDYNKPNETISMINKIMKKLNISIPQIFSDATKEIEIIRVYRKLWKLKQMKAYSKFNIQYLHYKLKPELIKPFKYLFILGNKEVIFVQELISCEHISKLSNNSFSIPAEYKFKHVKEGRDPIKRTNYIFTPEELNVMHAFISNCFNFAVIDETLYIHCYINYKHFKDSLTINRIISGHSKGYGKFIDSEFPGVDIYICDLTGLTKYDDYSQDGSDNSETNEIPNVSNMCDEFASKCFPLTNYMLNDKNNIKYDYNCNFKPYLDKISLNVDEGIRVIAPNRISDPDRS